LEAVVAANFLQEFYGGRRTGNENWRWNIRYRPLSNTAATVWTASEPQSTVTCSLRLTSLEARRKDDMKAQSKVARIKVKAVSILFAFALSISCTLASADSIQLRNGRHLQGKFIGGSTTTIGFMTAHSVEYFQTADVLALIFDNNNGGNNTGDRNPEPSTNGPHANHMDGSSSAVISPVISPANDSPTNNHSCRTYRNRKSASGTEVEVRRIAAGFRYVLE
jgi:hypothetical protein